MSGKSVLVDQFGREIQSQTQGRKFAPLPRRARSSYDAVRDSDEFRNYWAHADAFDADKSNSKATRHKAMRHSRYERGSNAYYAGIMETHCNMLVGVGPSLRCTSGNTRFNQLIERRFYRWWQKAQIRRKLWCMCHARTQDGESFGIIVNNPELDNDVQTDLILIEAEQVQTPFLPFFQSGYIDGIRFDEFHNVLWYDVLPQHPGGDNSAGMLMDPVRVPPQAMLHWFKMQRPGGHRGMPSLIASMNCGAQFRRWKEATVAHAETQMDYTVLLKTTMAPQDLQDDDALEPLDTVPIDKRQMTILPKDYDVSQLNADTPNAQYDDFHRSLISEMGRPLSMPYNVTASDSSTYSFASGKLDNIFYRAAIDVERYECNERVLEPLFEAWYREWALITGNRAALPAHQWDWPAHPVIDAESEARAVAINLENGTTTLRDVCTDRAQDYEDQLRIKAEDAFGPPIDDNEMDLNIRKMRNIDTLKNTPAHAIDFVAAILGVQIPQQQEPVL